MIKFILNKVFIKGLICGFIFLLSCQKKTTSLHLNSFIEVENPCAEGGESRFYQDANGHLWLSWVEYLDDTTSALMITERVNKKWTPAVEIAQGDDWFVNWADFPAVCGWDDPTNSLVAHWLQKSDVGKYNYDIMLKTSKDGGENWGEAFKLNQDAVNAEHGFVSFVPEKKHIFATWLDGRNTPSGGAMSLRAASIGLDEQITDTVLLDNRVCDCCQTTAISTTDWRLVAYRDRSEKEVRDIHLVRFSNGKWSAPYSPHSDNWIVAGCPVNGPSLAHQANHVALAWFSGAEEGGSNYLSFSEDGGLSFGHKIKLNTGPSLGRVDVEILENGETLALWMEPLGDKAQLFLQLINRDETKGELIQIAEVSASRSTGFPQLMITEEEVFISYTSVTDDGQRIKIMVCDY